MNLSPTRAARRNLLISILLVALTVGVFLPLVGYDFIALDDGAYVTANPSVRGGLTLAGLKWAFTSVAWASNWHPLTWLSHQADVEFFGLRPGWHHLVSLVMHAGGVLLLFGAWRRMTGSPWRSAAAAALFAVHPLRVESVAWISERKDVLVGLCFMLTLLCYLRYLERPSTRRYLFMAVVYAATLLAKPMAVSLPFVLILLDWWPLGRVGRRSTAQLLLEKMPLFLLAGGASAVTLKAQSAGGALASLGELPMRSRLPAAATASVWHLIKAAWPSRLAVYYPHPEGGLASGQAVAAAAGLAVLTAGAVLLRRRRPYLVTGWLWYLIMLLPVLGLIQAGGQWTADRYGYLPLAGVFAGASFSWPAPAGARARWVSAAFLLAVILGMASAARVQLSYWRNSESLFTRALAVTEDNWMMHNVLGQALLERGLPGRAEIEFRRGLAIMPVDDGIMTNLGKSLIDQGRFQEAAAVLERAVSVNPANDAAHYNLGVALGAAGRVEEAVSQYREVLRRRSDQPGAWGNLGMLLASLGRTAEAIAVYRQGLEHLPSDARLHNNLGILLAGQGRREEALGEFSQAVRLDPSYEEARRNLEQLGSGR